MLNPRGCKYVDCCENCRRDQRESQMNGLDHVVQGTRSLLWTMIDVLVRRE
jgi:hypothetical protein